jgi:hypothetical protein
MAIIRAASDSMEAERFSWIMVLADDSRDAKRIQMHST